jgi:hypothetical protein
MSGNSWRPIETAPKGDQSILAAQPFGEGQWRITTMLWSPKSQLWRADVHSFVVFQPTHWMPLPDPPKPDASSALQSAEAS